MARFHLNPTSEQIPTTADVVVIGGGPAGAGALWSLERAQPGIRTVLIERNDQLAAGASMASLENYRTTWAATCLARMMAFSYNVFHHAEAYLGEGTQLGLREQGYVWVGVCEADIARLKADVAQLHSVGMTHIEYLDQAEVRQRFPWMSQRVIAAKYDPRAGWLDSNGLIHGLARAAANADVLLGIAESRIQVESGRVTGVWTPNGTISTPRVILAAGANARAIGRTAGLELPIVVRPRQSFTTRWRSDAFPADAPMMIGSAPFPHVRPEAREGAIFGWEYEWNARAMTGSADDALIDPIWPADRAKDPRFPSLVLAVFARQLGEESGFADPRWLRGLDHRAGYYVYRDDSVAYKMDAQGVRHPYHSQRAIIDQAPGVEGLTLSVAHVGHGIMSAPAAGEIAAARALGLPLPDPAYADFGLDVPYVEHDAGGLSVDPLADGDTAAEDLPLTNTQAAS